MLLVQCAKLYALQLQGEAGTHLLETGTRAVFVELITVLTEEHKVTLVVHGHDTSFAQVSFLREERSQHATEAMA